MVATTAPTAVQVENAAEEVERLGLTEALDRRYARFGEIPENAFLWRPEAMEQGQKKGLGIFAGIQTRENQAKKVIHGSGGPCK